MDYGGGWSSNVCLPVEFCLMETTKIACPKYSLFTTGETPSFTSENRENLATRLNYDASVQLGLPVADAGASKLNSANSDTIKRLVRPTGIEPVLRVPERRKATSQPPELVNISAFRRFLPVQFALF